MVAGSLFLFNLNPVDFNSIGLKTNQKIVTVHSKFTPVKANNVTYASPEDTAALIAQINLMRKGNCQLIEAIQLPDSYKRVYFENIVLGQISTNLADQKLVHQLLEKVRCNYTPMLMANSK